LSSKEGLNYLIDNQTHFELLNW